MSTSALPVPLVRILLVALITTMSGACGGDGDGGMGPSVSVAGTWSGPASDSSGPGQMTWQLQQSDAAVSGALTMTDTGTGRAGLGTITGTMSGEALSFTLRVPLGGFADPWASCTAEVTGNAQVTTSTMTGSYTGNNSCTGPISSGQFTLTKS